MFYRHRTRYGENRKSKAANHVIITRVHIKWEAVSVSHRRSSGTSCYQHYQTTRYENMHLFKLLSRQSDSVEALTMVTMFVQGQWVLQWHSQLQL
jgi:hypothetical protein